MPSSPPSEFTIPLRDRNHQTGGMAQYSDYLGTPAGGNQHKTPKQAEEYSPTTAGSRTPSRAAQQISFTSPTQSPSRGGRQPPKPNQSQHKKNDSRNLNQAPSDVPLTEIHASPALQVILFFNVCYSFFCFVYQIVSFSVRASKGNLSVIILIVHIVLLLIVLVAEFLRLFAGYFGNLRERVPRLAAFMVISFLIAPIHLAYFIIATGDIPILERMSSIFLLLFILAELVFGSFAIWKVVRVSSRRYHLQFNADGSLYADAEDGALDNNDYYMEEVEMIERPNTGMSGERPNTGLSSDRPNTAMTGMSSDGRPMSANSNIERPLTADDTPQMRKPKSSTYLSALSSRRGLEPPGLQVERPSPKTPR